MALQNAYARIFVQIKLLQQKGATKHSYVTQFSLVHIRDIYVNGISAYMFRVSYFGGHTFALEMEYNSRCNTPHVNSVYAH